MNYKGTVINIDSDSPWFFMRDNELDYSNIEEKAEKYIEKYWNNGITDLVFCIFCQASESFSDVFEERAYKYDLEYENGIPVDYSDNFHIMVDKWLKVNKVDIFDIWINHTKKGGINPWISIRMNDVHLWDAKTSFLRSDFFYEARENGWLLPFGNVYNYSVEEVRTKMINYIKEQILRYDVYGLELDFTREMVLFDYKKYPESYLIMNDFMREVKGICEEAAEKHGHPIKIMVRTARDMYECKEYGLDVLTWAKEGMVDIVVPSSHWATTDSDMPIAKWVDALAPYNVEVYSGFEEKLNHWIGLFNNLETFKGFCVQYSSVGAQKRYLFNCFVVDRNFKAVKYGGKDKNKIWQICSDERLARQGVRRHIMTEQNDNTDRGYKGWEPLPKQVNGTANFDILTGEIYKSEKATLYIGIDGEDAEISVNGKKYEYTEDTTDAYIHTSKSFKCEKVLAVEFDTDETLKRQSIDVASKNCNVKYIEIKVIGN